VTNQNRFNAANLTRTQTRTITQGENSLSLSRERGLGHTTRTITAQQGENSATISQRRSAFGQQSTSMSTTRQVGDTQLSASAEVVNGRLRSESVGVESQRGNLTTSAELSQQYNRNGQVTSQTFAQSVAQQYGDTTLTRGNSTTLGQHHVSTTNSASIERGAFSAETQTTATLGRTTERTGGYSAEDGRHSFSTGVEVRNGVSVDRQTSATYDTRAEQRGTSEQETARTETRANQQATMDRIQQGGQILADLGLQTTLSEGSVSAEARAGLIDTDSTFVGARATASAEHEVTFGANGLQANASAEARAGLYAETEGSIEGDYGTLAGSAGARAEAYATADASLSLGANGLQAEAGVRVGAEVSANVNGSYTTPPVTIGGVEMTAGIDANARVAAEASAEATGRIQFTGHPPTAVIEGEVGASAVVKAEADATISAGPFSVTGSGYVSAGAEARAHASLGYDDGRLNLSFGAGAALGLGAGANVAISVDVAQIGEAATGLAREAGQAVVNTLDASGDGRLGLDDAAIIGQRVGTAINDTANAVGTAISDTANAVGTAISDTANAVGTAINDTANAVGTAISDTASSVGNAISDGAGAVRDFFSGW
jgi:hypothetical protein